MVTSHTLSQKPNPEPPVTVITPPLRWTSLGLQDVWEHRELLWFLVWRDMKVRYKQTALGVLWAVLQPLLTMVVFTLFFGRLAGVPSNGVPYPIFSFAALVPWTFFAYGLSQAANSLVTDEQLVRKVYFPRMVIPVATVLSGAGDLALAFLVLIGMMIYYGLGVTFQALWVLPLLLLALTTCLGVGLWLAALNVQYRDVRYTVPFLTQLWLFATPIAYPSSLLAEPWRTLNGLNPMAGVVEGFRWALLGTDTAPGSIIQASVVAALVLLLGGMAYFRRMESTFADVI